MCDLGPKESSYICNEALLRFKGMEETLSCEHDCGGSTGTCLVALFREAGEGGRISS